MSGWKGSGSTSLLHALETFETSKMAEAQVMMERLVEDGAVAMQDNLEAATTETGRERVASGRGRFEGRHRSGNMVGSITHSVVKQGNVLIGKWGWPNPEEYFLDQEMGPQGPSHDDKLPAANALFDSFATTRLKFMAGVKNLAKER